MKRVWKPLVYKGIDLTERFLVSNEGEIYSIKSDKILKKTLNKSTGYFGVCVSNGGRKNKLLIKLHIAVACMFCGGYKENLIVNHIDGNKMNNSFENLEWVTSKENTRHAMENDLTKNNYKIKCINTGEIFLSMRKACNWCGVSVSRMSEHFKDGSRMKTIGKHPVTKELLEWEFVK